MAEPEEHGGKLPVGQLSLRGTLEGSSFVIELNDDGRGIAWKRVGQRLRERGLPSTTTQDLVEGLFLDGLSTAAAVTDVSGRGIGMSALRAAVQERGGRIEIRSQLGAGTSLRCVFPASAVTVDPAWVLERELARQVACATLETLPRPAAVTALAA